MSQLHKDGNRLKLILNKREHKTLTHIRDRSEKSYQRERAAALLKVADGMSPHAVAHHGLLRKRNPDTVYSWIHNFSAFGLKSLSHAPRKSKSLVTDKEQSELVKTITEKSPQDFGLVRSRWTLKALKRAVPFLQRYRSLSGIWYLLRRLRIHHKRSLDVVVCPDSQKEKKIRRLRALLGYARKHIDDAVLLFLDEKSYYRQPLSGPTWWPIGRREQPKARRSWFADTRGRIIAALNAVSGELIYQLTSKVNVPCFCQFLQQIREIYQEVKVYVALDNWPTVHKHKDALETFIETDIKPVWLPTYSPQSNPIELLWEWLNEEVLRLHQDSDDFSTLKQRVSEWLNPKTQPSQQTIQMVGLNATPAIRVNDFNPDAA